VIDDGFLNFKRGDRYRDSFQIGGTDADVTSCRCTERFDSLSPPRAIHCKLDKLGEYPRLIDTKSNELVWVYLVKAALVTVDGESPNEVEIAIKSACQKGSFAHLVQLARRMMVTAAQPPITYGRFIPMAPPLATG
jgi:hypothetical protein